MQFEVINELTLKVTMTSGEFLHTKSGSMIAFQGDMDFEKELLGPGQNVVGQVLGQLTRRFTGENMHLMKARAKQQSVCYFAFDANHIIYLDLMPGQRLGVESENILAFSDTCKYGVMFMPTGTVSQKGLATSTLEGPGQVALLVDGNPIMLNGACCVDPDALVAFVGQQPTIGLDLSWKNLIGQASGETYNMKFNDPNNVIIIQPKERNSGINLGMDGGSNGQSATNQSNGIGNMIGNMFR